MLQNSLNFLPLNATFNDSAEPWGLFFQDNATPQMEDLEELRNNIMFYLVIVLFAVSWIMLSIIFNYRAKLFKIYTNNGILMKLILSIIPVLILMLVLIAFIFSKLVNDSPSIFNDSPEPWGLFFQDNTWRSALEEQTIVCENWEQPFSNARRNLYATYYNYNDIMTTVSNRQLSGNFIAAYDALKEQHYIRITRLLEPINMEDRLTHIKWDNDMIKTRLSYTSELKTLLNKSNANFTEQEQRDINEIKNKLSQALKNYIDVRDGYKRDLLTQRSLRQVLSR